MRTVLSAIDALDRDGILSLCSPDVELMTAYGSEGKGLDEASAIFTELFRELRHTHHEIHTEWNPEPDVWIAEVTATYELRDASIRGPFRRVFILRAQDGLMTQLRIYGSHEQPLPAAEGRYQEVYGAHSWMPTL